MFSEYNEWDRIDCEYKILSYLYMKWFEKIVGLVKVNKWFSFDKK